MSSASIQLFALIPVAFSVLIDKAHLPDWLVTTILTSYIFGTLVHGYFHVKFQKKALLKLDTIDAPEDNWIQKAFNDFIGDQTETEAALSVAP